MLDNRLIYGAPGPFFFGVWGVLSQLNLDSSYVNIHKN